MNSASRKALPFRGSFLMSFSVSSASQKKAWPFLWTVDVSKMGMEIQDDMNKKGLSKRIIYNLADSTWLMLMHYNKVMQATRIHAAGMFRDTIETPAVKIKFSGEQKNIQGYDCKKIIAESQHDIAELWVTDALNFDVAKLYKMLSHCGMMTSYVDEGTWYFVKKIEGMVLQVTSTNKQTQLSYTMSISDIKPDEVIYAYFDLTGFKVSDIPEGQGCGPMKKNDE